jgi:glyoxalase family protein
MKDAIQGIHHITSMAKDANRVDRFFKQVLGLRRVKQTVNFDAPDVYHLYYANGGAEPGSVMTYFPFPLIVPGVRGSGEVTTSVFAVPEGSLGFWQERLSAYAVHGIGIGERFGTRWLRFEGSEGDSFALTEQVFDPRQAWGGADVSGSLAIRGFTGASLLLRDEGATRELLEAMGYRVKGRDRDMVRLMRDGGNAAEIIDIEVDATAPRARQGAGSVHHIALAVAKADLATVRDSLVTAGFNVTPQIDRDYFMSLYFRTPGGVLFEIATNEPGFTRDEAIDHLGERLQLPQQHAHLRPYLEDHLPPLEG